MNKLDFILKVIIRNVAYQEWGTFMGKFRMVILDNAKEQLDNSVAQKILSDTVFTKQKNFLRTDENYVVTDKHDMIGTHYLIYDTTEFLSPKLIFAIRTTFLSRAKQHRIDTPLLSLVPTLDNSLQDEFYKFQKRYPEIIDCNAWFVDPAFSKKNAGLNLSDLGYFMVCMSVMRMGGNHIVGCTNETYGASRWLANVGTMKDGLLFEHPVIKSPHKMLLVENFNLQHFERIYFENKALIDDIYEVLPSGHGVQLLPDFLEKLFDSQSTKRGVSKAA